MSAGNRLSGTAQGFTEIPQRAKETQNVLFQVGPGTACHVPKPTNRPPIRPNGKPWPSGLSWSNKSFDAQQVRERAVDFIYEEKDDPKGG